MSLSAFMEIEKSGSLNGTITLNGAKNAALVIIASLLLTRGKSRLTNIPASDDVLQMISLLRSLGANVSFDVDEHSLEVDTTDVNKWHVSPEIMKKMRASILVMGPLLARFCKAEIALPGGCAIGMRPIDYHIKNFKKMGATVSISGEYLTTQTDGLKPARLVLEYPSVGATENSMMAAVLTPGITTIVNAALEPEVLDLIDVLRKMGAKITIFCPATIVIEGVATLHPIEHAIIPDRLEAGALLLAAAITGGSVTLPQAHAHAMDVFLLKLEEMGHQITVGQNGVGLSLVAADTPQAVSIKTAPYPGFPTDLQAPLSAALCLAQGQSIIEESVFENRLSHLKELQKLGAKITIEHNKAFITGVNQLMGTNVQATDIRASCALMLSGLVAQGITTMTGLSHWMRGYDGLEKKLQTMGALITMQIADQNISIPLSTHEIETGKIL